MLYAMKKRWEKLREKKARLDQHRPLPPELVRNLEEWLRIELTYTSNAIEGNTLTRNETALVVGKGLTVAGKTLQEHLEAVNHAGALDWIRALVVQKKKELDETDLLALHRMILKGIDDRNAGRYRDVAVRIAGSTAVLPNPQKVPTLMKDFFQWLPTKSQEGPVQKAADAHFRLVSIHPFVDGNGRTARLVMNLLLLQAGYPPALITKEERLRYINAIEKGQLSGAMEDYDEVIADAVERTLDIYLQGVEGESPIASPREEKLLKIGELSKQAGESVPTIRYWVERGLLSPAEKTATNYQLFHPSSAERIIEIRRLQQKERLTLDEIRERLSTKGA